MARRANSIKSLALEYLKSRVAENVKRGEIEAYVRSKRGEVSAGEVTRRIRELRQLDGWPIESQRDVPELAQDEYRLTSLSQGPQLPRRISKKLAYEILERDGYTCQSCGIGAGDPDPYGSSRPVKLEIDHITPHAAWDPRLGDWNQADNLRTLCSNCNAGKKGFIRPAQPAKDILEVLRASRLSIQREVYDVLMNKFEPGRKPPWWKSEETSSEVADSN